jgi:hypothetical protein
MYWQYIIGWVDERDYVGDANCSKRGDRFEKIVSHRRKLMMSLA